MPGAQLSGLVPPVGIAGAKGSLRTAGEREEIVVLRRGIQ